MIRELLSTVRNVARGVNASVKAWADTRESSSRIQEASNTSALNILNQLYTDTDNMTRKFNLNATLPRTRKKAEDSHYSSGERIDPTTGATRTEAQLFAEYLYRATATGKNVVLQRANHTVGGDFSVSSKDPNVDALLTEMWEKYSLSQILYQMVRDTEEFGECFIFRNRSGSLRIVEPFTVYAPTTRNYDELCQDGVQCFDKNDPTTAYGYWIEDHFFPASRVFHIRSLYTNSGEFRGWPELFDARNSIIKYERFIDARGSLNIARSAIMFVRTHKGRNLNQIRSILNQVKSGETTEPDGVSRPVFNDNGATVMDVDENTSVDFKAPNTGASEAAEDGRAINQQGATAFQMPGYMYSGDVSSSGYAGIAVSEAPGVKSMKTLQEYYGWEVRKLLKWIDPRAQNVSMAFPQLISRSELDLCRALDIESRNGTLSRDTWMEIRGRDPRTERENMTRDGTGV